MTSYTGWVYPDPDIFQQVLSTSLSDGLARWDAYTLVDLVDEGATIWAPRTHSGSFVPFIEHLHAGFVMPTYADDLFGHIIALPPRLDLGNLLANQTRTVEVANLDYTPHNLNDIVSDVDGLTLNNAPSFPHAIQPFGSFVLSVSISTNGPPTIAGGLTFDFDSEELPVPVTGTRIVMFVFMPQRDAEETLKWGTDVLEARDGTEQRISFRIAPRQIIKYQVATEGLLDFKLRALLFDWLPRVWGVPIWFEKRDTQIEHTAGSTVIHVDTAFGDFRIGGLCLIYSDADHYDASEIEDIDATTITLTSALTNDYAAGALVMPVRTAYAQTAPTVSRYHGGFEKTSVQFTTLDNEDLGDATGATVYDGRVVLDDGNVVTDTLGESWDRPVIVIDNGSGQIFQTSRTDRSRIKTTKTWDAPSLEELWRIRRLLHHFRGSQKSLWLPTCRPDLFLSQSIGPGATSFRVVFTSYTSFANSRRPFADVQFYLTNGTVIRRHITGSTVDGDEEVISVNTSITSTEIEVGDVSRIELLLLVRIADDEANFSHRGVADATVSVQLVSIKE